MLSLTTFYARSSGRGVPPGLARALGWTSLVAALALGACGDEEAPEAAPEVQEYRIQTEVARTEALSNQIITSAAMEAEAWQPLYFDGSGVVKRVGVKESQRVTAGQLLASLDDESQALSVEKAELNVKQAQLNEEQAAHKLDQTRALIETGGASPENVYDKEQRLLEAQNQRAEAELNLKSQQLRLESMRIVAPFSGMVSEVNIRVGDLVRGEVEDPDRDMNRRPPIVMVNPESGILIRAHLPEGRAPGITVGTLAEVVLMEARQVKLMGKVSAVAATVDRDTRTVHVDVALEPAEGGFPPEVRDGATALITFLTDTRQDAVTVSERAVFYFQDHTYAFIVQPDETVRRAPIQVGVMRGGRVEVISGLTPGDQVARSHMYLLRDGQKVIVDVVDAAEGVSPAASAQAQGEGQ